MKKKSTAKIVGLIAIPLVPPIALFLVMMLMIGGFMYKPTDTWASEGFSLALGASISVNVSMGLNFCDVLTAYYEAYGDFEAFNDDKLNSLLLDQGRYKSLLGSDDAKTRNQAYREMYGPIISFLNQKYYCEWYFPIPDGYSAVYSNDFFDPRSYKDLAYNFGTDITATEGTPIVAIEGGTLENIGWNSAGGWRIGIRSGDKIRYWYYAHMRKVHPYVASLKKGGTITAGQVIGYVGSTGYSDTLPDESMPENSNAVDGKFPAHVHVGVQYASGNVSPWINPYSILRFVEANKVKVIEDKVTHEFVASQKSLAERGIVVKWNLTDAKKRGGVLVKPTNGFAFPSPYATIITSGYGMRFHPIFKQWTFHTGIDLSDDGCENTPVVSIDDGVVIETGTGPVDGQYVWIQHTIDGQPWKTKYQHLNRIDVKKDQQVKKGQQIGLLGNTGDSTGAHLHFEIWPNGVRADPELYLFSN